MYELENGWYCSIEVTGMVAKLKACTRVDNGIMGGEWWDFGSFLFGRVWCIHFL